MSIARIFRRPFGKSTGWKKAAKVNCTILIIASLILVGLSIAVIANNNFSILFILSADCDGNLASAVNIALHLLINIVSTLVVQSDRFASSNFFMQVLNAPSREEIDIAHSKGSWLGIGVPSVRNIFLVTKFKAWCWVALLISSIPIHLLFNSTIFETDYANSNFTLTIATEEFTHGGHYFPPGASLMAGGQNFSYLHLDGVSPSTGCFDTVGFGDNNEYNSMNIQSISKAARNSRYWTKLGSKECWENYVNCGNIQKYSDLVIVVDKPGGWIRQNMWELSTNQSRFWDRHIPPDEPNHLFFNAFCGWQPDAFDLSMKYCLAETQGKICHVALVPMLLLYVTAAIVVKTIIALIVTITLSRVDQPPLATLGDAVASFIKKPDLVTAGFCTFGHGDMKLAVGSKNTLLVPGPRSWQIRQKRRLASIPRQVWLTSYLLFIASISTAIYFYRTSDVTDYPFLPNWRDPTINLGISLTLTQSILLVNTPQLLLSVYYLAFNNLFTRIQMAKEWGALSTEYRSLRVTEPQGEQFSTYRLQLPYKYSLPLLTMSVALHWLLSNTIYVLVSIGGILSIFFSGGYLRTAYSSNSEPGYFQTTEYTDIEDPSFPPDAVGSIQYSSVSLLTLVITSSTLICLPVLFSLKHLPQNSINPSSNSLALSAACHVSKVSYNLKAKTQRVEDFVLPAIPQSSSSLLDSVLGSFQNEIRTDSTVMEAGLRTWTNLEGLEARVSDEYGPSEQTVRENGIEPRERSLKELAQGKIRWGVVKMPPEWYIEHAGDGPVEHLGFGAEEDEVSSPVPGNFYA
ncbi:hypothetical protein F4678DRAFT_486848 [Xylaria arbuscula]|nr:hypothetical protein F4678DRAFT_486848 [Xylaria arbuscula]